MSYNAEYCDPFDGEQADIWMKLEHCGRYLFACDYLSDKRLHSVLDVASACGYGSSMLSNVIPQVTAADRNQDYLSSAYYTEAKHAITRYCFDFDSDSFPQEMLPVDSIVCFETIEHLRQPYSFLEKIDSILKLDGYLLLSFPNEKYERKNPDGSNRDPYHLHILPLDEIKKKLSNLGYSILSVLGQPICNIACSRQHDLRESNILSEEIIKQAFRYDSDTIRALSLILAYPQENNVDESYSYLIISQKQR